MNLKTFSFEGNSSANLRGFIRRPFPSYTEVAFFDDLFSVRGSNPIGALLHERINTMEPSPTSADESRLPDGIEPCIKLNPRIGGVPRFPMEDIIFFILRCRLIPVSTFNRVAY